MPTPRRAVVALHLAPAVLHLCWLGWHALSSYEPWQVAGLVVSLAALVVATARRVHVWTVGWTVTLGVVVAWSVDAATTPSLDTNLWPIGTMMLLFVTFPAVLVLAVVVAPRVRAIASAQP